MSSDSRAQELQDLTYRDRLAARMMRRVLAQIDHGHITLILPSSERLEHRGEHPGGSATLALHRWRAIWRLVSQGDLGFAEAYIDGDWSSPDLAGLLELAARNFAQTDRGTVGLLPGRLLNRFRHLLRANSRAGSRKNISFHYDLGNAFYQCWLDRGMSYSSALYERPDQTLEEAQSAKLSRIVELLDLRGRERILEIGCGWGALALELARSGCQVTGITLSERQLAFARQRVDQESAAARISLALSDYREAQGSYNRIVSIEMLEAVGEAYWPVYFKMVNERLRVGGIAVLQVITISEARFKSYRKSADFIQRHIFPGGMLPTREIIISEAAMANLKLVSQQRFGLDYARTLCEWRRRFLASWPRISEMGFTEAFRRLWEYYFCYCEAGFKAGTIDVGLFVFEKRRAS